MSERLEIIGLTGLARSGKDTAAGILAAEYGFTRVGFGDGVRDAFRSIDGPTWELGKDLEQAGKSSRWALQVLGTEAREVLKLGGGYRYLWIDTLLCKVRYLAFHHPKPRLRIVVPDVRFPQEADMIRIYAREWAGVSRIVRIERDGAGLQGPEGQHASETQVRDVRADVVIRNDQRIMDLAAELDCLVDELAKLEPEPLTVS